MTNSPQNLNMQDIKVDPSKKRLSILKSKKKGTLLSSPVIQKKINKNISQDPQVIVIPKTIAESENIENIKENQNIVNNIDSLKNNKELFRKDTQLRQNLNNTPPPLVDKSIDKNEILKKEESKRENIEKKEKEIIANISDLDVLKISDTANIKENKNSSEQEEAEVKQEKQEYGQGRRKTTEIENKNSDNTLYFSKNKDEDNIHTKTEEERTIEQEDKFQRNKRDLTLAKIHEKKKTIISGVESLNQKENRDQFLNNNKKYNKVLPKRSPKKTAEVRTVKEKVHIKTEISQKISQEECLVMQKEDFDEDLREYLNKISQLGVKKRKNTQVRNLEKIMDFYHLGDKFKNKDIRELLDTSYRSASRYLKALCLQSRIVKFSHGRETFYRKS